MKQRFIVIGITDHPAPWFLPEVLDVIHHGSIFSGGRRHHEIVASLLPEDAQWIDITVPLDNVFEQYRATSEQVIIFASGDPLFFGFANTIRRKMPDAEVVVYPAFNSLQLLAHRLLLPYHDMRIVSLTGRPWPEFDRALIERAEKIGILTDREHTPAAIAKRMLEYGYNNYIMNIGEHLGNPQLETVSTCTLEEAAKKDFSMPNCLILTTPLPRREGLGVGLLGMGLPDAKFTLLDGREKMITKMPIRLLTLQALDLTHRQTLWDIGACTGSVSIEARRLFPHLEIHAFEIRPECEAIIQENARRFGAPGIHLHIGDFMAYDLSPLTSHLSPLTSPDAIFIGGHGGHLKDIMRKAVSVLAPGGVIVMNSVKAPRVTTDSHQLWDEACTELHLQQDPPMRIQLNEHHPITILRCRK